MRCPLMCWILLVTGCTADRPPAVPTLPDATDVARATVTVSGVVSGQPDIAEFELPAEFVPELLGVLGPAAYSQHPRPEVTQEVGLLRFACREGRDVEVRLVFAGKEPVRFTLQGVPCVRGGAYHDLAPGKDKYLPEVLTLEGYLRAVGRGDREAARGYLNLLRRSAGKEDS